MISKRIKLVVRNYVPPSQNALRGVHWGILHRESHRAALALTDALMDVIASRLDATLYDPSIGTITDLNLCRTLLSNAVSYRTTLIQSCKGKSSPKRYTQNRKNGRK